MSKQKNQGLIGLGLLAAIAASLCCIAPVLALIAGISGLAATFSWVEPARPYFIGLSILTLGISWYQKLKARKKIDCDCKTDDKQHFLQSKKFLIIITVFAALMLTFPYYSGILYQGSKTKTIIINKSNITEATLTIEGMTCTGCEHSVNHALNENIGVIEASSSYETGISTIKFDKSKVSIDELASSVERETGYKVVNKKIQINTQ